MTSRVPTLLGIAPGTREFGVAVFRGFELVYFAVRTFRRRAISPRHLKREVIAFWEDFYEVYRPEILALKEINQYQRTSPNLLLVSECLKDQAQKSQVLSMEVTLAQIRSLLGDCKKTTNKRVFRAIAALYPELQQYENRPSQGQREYYAHIFSAVAVGLVCLNDLTQQINSRSNLKK